jgi:uncharacterized repeat protein (TIGR03847 family)
MTFPQWNFDHPDRFIVGTIGAPGEREFYLQIRQANVLISLATEKSQVSALAQRISTIIREVKKNSSVNLIQPMRSDDGPLELPLESEFTVGAIGIAFDPSDLEIEISFRSDLDESEDPTESLLPTVEVRLDLSQAMAFVSRTQALVAGGRPLCPFCISPIDPQGHLCPRANGYRR